MAGFFELKRQALRWMEQSGALAQRCGFETASDTIKEQTAAFQKKQLMVVAAGEARRGKSSLLNALLGEVQPLFPVDINVCTNVVTVVRYGRQEKIEAYLEDAAQERGYRVETITREQIPEYVSEQGNPNNYKNVQMLNAFIPNELMKEGVVFVDTPGVGSLNVAHAETTYSFLPNADLLLFVSDADSGMTESELSFLKRGCQYCPSVLFPLTKKDLNANYQTILEDNRTKISAALDIPEEEVRITPVSSMARLRALKTGSRTMYTNSNFAALEEQLWTAIAKRRGEVLLRPYLLAVKGELLKMMDSLTAQVQVLGSDQGTMEDWIAELNQAIAQLETLQSAGADWRSQLTLFFTVLQNEVTAKQQQIAAEARALVDHRVAEMKTKICRQQNYTQLLCDINDCLTRGVIAIRDLIEQRTTEQSASIESRLNLSVSVNQDILERLNFTPSEEIPVEFAVKKTSDKLIKKGRSIAMNTMGGTAIGTVALGGLGGLVGLCIGGPALAVAFAELGASYGGTIGTALGGAKGCVEALGKYDELDVSTVSKALNQHIATSMSGMSIATGNTLAELRITLTATFDQTLKLRARELQEEIKRLREHIKRAKSEIPQTLAGLKQQLAQGAAQLAGLDAIEAGIGALCAGEQPGEDPAASAAAEAPAQKEEVTYGFL